VPAARGDSREYWPSSEAYLAYDLSLGLPAPAWPTCLGLAFVSFTRVLAGEEIPAEAYLQPAAEAARLLPAAHDPAAGSRLVRMLSYGHR
jgi:hypothetical protein